MLRIVAVHCLVLAVLVAGDARGEEAESPAERAARDARSAVAEARAAMDRALLAVRGPGAPSREAFSVALARLKEAQQRLQAAATVLESQVGPPHYSIEVVNREWREKTRTEMREQRVGPPRPHVVREGGWLTLHVKVTAEHLYQPLVAARLLVTMQGMDGYQYEYSWDDKGAMVAEGASERRELVIWIPEERLDGYGWLRRVDTSHLTKALRIEPVWAVYEDGTRWGRDA